MLKQVAASGMGVFDTFDKFNYRSDDAKFKKNCRMKDHSAGTVK